MDDAHQMDFDRVAMDSIQWNHPSLFMCGPRSLDIFMVQNPVEVAAYVYQVQKGMPCVSQCLLCQVGTADIKTI